MDDAPVDRFDALRDSIVAHLEQVQLQLHADIEGVEERLHEEIQGVERRLHDEIGGVEARLTRRLDAVDARLDTLRGEIAERFESVDQRFRTPELRMTLFENRHAARNEQVAAELAVIRTAIDTGIRGELEVLKKQVASLDASLVRLNGRLDLLEAAVSSWAGGMAGLGEDVKQRFRVMNDRLAGIEQRLAA